MVCSDSSASNTHSTLCEDEYTNPELYDELKEAKEEEDTVDYDGILGNILREGTINAQNNVEEWVQCHIIIREKGITLSYQAAKQESIHKKKAVVDVMMEFSTPQEVRIVVLPDNARRSRESKLFPFAVQRKSFAEDGNTITSKSDKNVTGGAQQQVSSDELILATSNGREMWEWASLCQWLGTAPKEENIPLFHEASTIADHNEHYEEAEVLQNALLKIFTYKNLPNNPISFEELASINVKQKHHVFMYAEYPDDDKYQTDDTDDDTILIDGMDNDNKSHSANEDDEDACNEIKDFIIENTPEVIIENHAHTFGLFAYIVLVGACVHVNEKCFELITSSNLYDISSQVVWKGNSPFSMLCEGDYNPSRTYMVQALWRLGYPQLEGHYADYCNNKAFSVFVAKPANLYNIRSLVGGPVHPDDQKLCRYLRDSGDGREDNKNLVDQLIKASNNKSTDFESKHHRRITAVTIPKSIIDWGRTTLSKLDLSRNGIFELPEELYGFTNITHLDLSSNCLFGLSHKLGNLTNLTHFDISLNLIEELPYTMEKLEKIEEFQCNNNPITTPPSAVWSGGITNVRNFFRDMRESGTEINVDLRVLVLGLSEAGKTSLINGLINPDATALTRVGDRTVGIEKRIWVMERNENEQPINLLTYDFAGQEEYYITHHMFLGSKALYIIAFDLSKYEPNLLDMQIMLWWDSIQNRVCDVKSNDSKTPKVILVGTHADMVDDAQSIVDVIHNSLTKRFQLRMKDLEYRLQNLEKELDDLDPRRNVESDDEGPKRQGNLTDEEAGKQREKNFAKLPASRKAQILSRESEIEKIHHEQQCTIALPNAIHAVSSKDLRNFEVLKEQVSSSLTEFGPSGKYFPHLDAPVPRSWFQVRRFVRQLSTQKGCECMILPKYFKLLSDELDINMDVGLRATKFCHDLGDVLFFEKENLVFLQPSFLIDIFKYVIRHDHKESTYWTEKMLDRNISEEQFNRGKDLLLQKGELEQWLLELLWSRIYDDWAESSITNNLIQLLETFDIGTSIEQNGCKILSIPEFQPKFLNINWPQHKDDGDFEIQRWVSVDQNLPHGLLKRIQVRIFKKVFKRSRVKEYNLAQNQIYILDKHSSKLYCMSGKRTEECPGYGISEGIRLYIRGPNKHCVMSLLSKVYACVEGTLNDYPGLMFDHYAVHTTQHGSSFLKLEEVQAMQDAGEDKICVPIQIQDKDSASPTLKVEEAILDINNFLPPSLDNMTDSWTAKFQLK